MDKIRNEYIRGTAQVGRFGEKTREARLRWYGPKRRFMDTVREDMTVVEVTEEDAEDWTKWRWKICCDDPRRENMKEE